MFGGGGIGFPKEVSFKGVSKEDIEREIHKGWGRDVPEDCRVSGEVQEVSIGRVNKGALSWKSWQERREFFISKFEMRLLKQLKNNQYWR